MSQDEVLVPGQRPYFCPSRPLLAVSITLVAADLHVQLPGRVGMEARLCAHVASHMRDVKPEQIHILSRQLRIGAHTHTHDLT